MATQRQLSAKRPKMAERAAQQRALHFPDLDMQRLWLRSVNHGFTTVPRTLPCVMQAIDEQSKGNPAGHTLFCLWARSPDHPLVIIENPATFAAEAGFSGERVVDTWRRRMRRLQELGFIEVKKGAAGDFNYVLLLNPNVAMEYMHQAGQVRTELYSRFLIRLTEVGGGNDIEPMRAAREQAEAPQAAQASNTALGQVSTPGSMEQARGSVTPTRPPKSRRPKS